MKKYSLEEDYKRTKNILKKTFSNIQITQENRIYDEKNINICNTYKKEEHDYFLDSNTNSHPKSITQMMLNSMKLEKNRLSKFQLEKEIIDQDLEYNPEKNEISIMYNQDGKNLLCRVHNKQNNCQIKYNKNDNCIYKIRKDSNIKYFIISSIFANEKECMCPNCGHTSKVEELIGGCPYCKSKFTIEDLKGKINSTFESNNQLKQKNGFSMIPTVVSAVMLLLGVILFNLVLIAIGVLAMFYSIKKGMKTSVPSSRVIEYLQKKDPLFSEELLLGNISTKLNIVHYANESKDLGVLIQIPEQDKIKIVEDYHNVIYSKITKCTLIDFNTSNEMDYIDTEVDVDLYKIMENEKVILETEKLKVKLKRNSNIKTNNMLEIMMHQCEKCGANIDPLSGVCNYCGESLNLENYDWIICKYQKLK